jgi:hypothetical protein
MTTIILLFLSCEQRIPVAGCRNLRRVIVAFYCAQTVDKALLVVRAAEQKTQRERILGQIVNLLLVLKNWP